jgi:hypothetical protein
MAVKRTDHHLDYEENGAGDSGLKGLRYGYTDSDREYFAFREIILDWQMHLGIGSPKEMLAFLGNSRHESSPQMEKDWQDILLGTAAPDHEYLRFLSDLYAQTRGRGMVSAHSFSETGLALIRQANATGRNEEDVPLRIIAPPPHKAVEEEPVAPPTGALREPKSIEFTRRALDETINHHFYARIKNKVEVIARKRKDVFPTTLNAVAIGNGFHPWMLQGFMPVQRGGYAITTEEDETDTRKSAEEKIPKPASDDDTGRYNRKRINLLEKARDFLTSPAGLDLVGGCTHGTQLSYGQIVKVLCQEAEITKAQLTEIIAQRGVRIYKSSIESVFSGRTVPSFEIAKAI